MSRLKVQILIYAILLIFGFIVGYSQKNKKLVIVQEKKVVEQELPECFSGQCPSYYSMNVDGESNQESAVIIPTAMSQGLGKVWIIDEGKLIFDSGEKMRIGITQTNEQKDLGTGFILRYATEFNSNEGVSEEYLYQDGHFVIVNE